MEVGKKIKGFIEDKGISQAYLSKKTNIPAVKLNLALNGKRRLSFEEYESICWALEVSVGTFLEAKAPENVS